MTTERTPDSKVGAVLRRNIDGLLAARGMKPKDLYDAMDMSASAYSQLFKREEGPKLTTLIRIAEALDCEPSELIE